MMKMLESVIVLVVSMGDSSGLLKGIRMFVVIGISRML